MPYKLSLPQAPAGGQRPGANFMDTMDQMQRWQKMLDGPAPYDYLAAHPELNTPADGGLLKSTPPPALDTGVNAAANAGGGGGVWSWLTSLLSSYL